MAFPGPGPGRPKGSKNKITFKAEETLQRIGLDPLAAMAQMAMGEVECAVCKGSGRIVWQGSEREFKCDACKGSGKDHITPELKGKMLAELAKYVAPQRKATEITADVKVGLLELLAGLPQDQPTGEAETPADTGG